MYMVVRITKSNRNHNLKGFEFSTQSVYEWFCNSVDLHKTETDTIQQNNGVREIDINVCSCNLIMKLYCNILLDARNLFHL